MSEKIRILHIVPNMQSGGLENFIMNIYRNIDNNLIEFDFLVHYLDRKFFDNEIERRGGKIYRFSLRNDNNLIKYIKEIDSFYKNHPEYKIIHCHMESIGFIHFLLAKKNGVNVRIAHSHSSSTNKNIKGYLKKILKMPYKYTSTINFACSENAADYLFRNRQVTIIPNAINTERFIYKKIIDIKVRENLNIPHDAFIIGHIGRFSIEKNHKFIIKLFSQYNAINSNSFLLLVGDGELKQDILDEVKKRNLINKVIFTGAVENTEDYYSAMNLFILPSLFEGFPMTAIEAQANGLKCIFSDIVTREVDISNNCFFLSPNEVDEWINLIDSLNYDRDNNINRVLTNSDYNIKYLTKKIQKIYLDLNKGGEIKC